MHEGVDDHESLDNVSTTRIYPLFLRCRWLHHASVPLPPGHAANSLSNKPVVIDTGQLVYVIAIHGIGITLLTALADMDRYEVRYAASSPRVRIDFDRLRRKIMLRRYVFEPFKWLAEWML